MQTHAGGELRIYHNTPTRKRSHQAQDIHTSHITLELHSHARDVRPRACDVYHAHRHGSESPHPGSTPGLNPFNHLAWQACGPCGLTQTQHIPNHQKRVASSYSFTTHTHQHVTTTPSTRHSDSHIKLGLTRRTVGQPPLVLFTNSRHFVIT